MNRVGNSILEQQIIDKLNKICDKQGELYYKEIKHPDCDKYSDLNILVRKALLNKLPNTLIVRNNMPGTSSSISVCILFKGMDIDRIFRMRDNRINLRDNTSINYNDLFYPTTMWYKLYKTHDCSKELDFINDIENSMNLNLYLRDDIILYAIRNEYRLPLVNFDKTYENKMNELKKQFTKEEIEYIKTTSDYIL